MSKPFMDAILNQKPADGTKVIAVCPKLSRADFIRTLPADHPARIMQEKILRCNLDEEGGICD
jgi:hypothetical protein